MFEKIKKFFKKEKKKMADLDKMLESLTEEEKKDLKAKLQDLYKAEDEREVDKIEEEKADSSEKAEEKREEAKEESEEIGKDVDEIEEKIEDEKSKEESREEEQEEKHDSYDERLSRMEQSIARLEEVVGKLVSSKDTTVEEKAEEVYGLGNGVFQAEEKASETKNVTPSDINKLLNRIKR